MSLSKAVLLAGALTLSSAAAAMAAQSTVALHVRSGPSTGYGVVDTLYAGESVNVQECASNGWCRITHSGPDGWVSARYLTDTSSRNDRDERPSRPDRTPRPDINFSISGPGFGFSIGNGSGFDWRPRNRGGYVCFYEDFNFRGDRFCARPGQKDRRLGSFNDKISSIRVVGNAEVQVCEDYNYRGRCAVLDSSNRSLNGRNNDIISSYRVR